MSNHTFSKTPNMVRRPGLLQVFQFLGSGWAIIRIIVKKTMSCRRTVKPQSDADLSFSKDEIAIKRTNAQISGMEYFKWDLQTNWNPEK